jgi:hypothetical protein
MSSHGYISEQNSSADRIQLRAVKRETVVAEACEKSELELEVTVAVSSEFLVGDSHGKFVNS